MSLLDTASLLLTPNAYKEGKLYSIIPENGDGDFTFTRATTATRVNSDGLVELVPYNFIVQSVWQNGNLNVAPIGWGQQNTTGNFEPFSSINGNYSYRFWGVNARRYLTQNVSIDALKKYVISFNVENVTTSSNLIQALTLLYSGSATFTYQVDGVTFPSSTLLTPNTIVSVIIDTTTSGVLTLRIGGGGSSNQTYDYILSSPQLVEGSTALPYQKTETRLNIPRLDYSNGTCPSILLEPQRTNLLTYSNNFNDASWVKLGAGTGSAPVVTQNYGLSPSGNNDSTRIQLNLNGGTSSSLNQSLIYKIPTGLATLYSNSIYIKGTAGQSVYFGRDLSNHIIVVTNGQWQRVTYSYNLAPIIGFGARGSTGSSDVLDIEIWGAQLEAGSYATSYIPTTTASVTRNAEVLSKTGISSLLNSSQGVLYFEAKALVNNTGTSVISISNGTNQNTLYLGYSGTANSLVSQLIVGGVAQCNFNHTLSNATDTHKVAVMYASNNAKFYVNGVQIDVDTTINVPSSGTFDRLLNNLGQGSFPFYSNLSSILYFNTTLTDDQLAQLTTI